MAYNIFERWPFTSFQNLNLDWLMKATKEAVTTAQEAADSVDQFDNRISANAAAIAELADQLNAVQGTYRVFVNSDLETFHSSQHITGLEIRSAMQTEGFPVLEYNGESYIPETWTTAGDIRFYTIHVDSLGSAVMRRLLIPAQSYNAAYSIVDLGSGGSGSANTVTVTITDRGEYATPQYISDHSYAEILSAIQRGKAILLNVIGSSATSAIHITTAVMMQSSATVSGQSRGTFLFLDPTELNRTSPSINYYVIREDGEVYYLHGVDSLVTMNTLFANAVSIYPQELTATEQAQARANIGAGQIPAFTASDANKFLQVNSTGTATGWEAMQAAPVQEITITDTQVQETIDPNKFYVFPNPGQMDIVFGAAQAGIVNEYHFRFTSGSTPTELSLPGSVIIPDDFYVEANTVYEISIIDNYMVYSSWAVNA